MAEPAGGVLTEVRARLGLSTRGPYAHLVQERVELALAGRARSAEGDPAGAPSSADPALWDALVEAVVVRETHFLREPERLRHLVAVLLPGLLEQRPPGHVLQVWSAGCSTGEEPYSVAMLLDEHGGPPARLLAGDISPSALRRAAEGVYGPWSFRGVPAEVRERHFQREGSGVRISPHLRERVAFHRLNLVSDPYPPSRDVILCRNVLVYLEPEVQERVARRLAAALAPGGYLITAVTDPVLPDVTGLQPVRTPGGFVYRRGDSAADHPPAPRPRPPGTARAGRPVRTGVAPDAPAAAAPAASDDSTSRRAELRRLLQRRDLEVAAALAHDAVGRWPLDAELRYLQAVLALERGRPQEALPAATGACYLAPGLPAVHVLLGHVEHALGQRERATRSWRHAATLLQGGDVADVEGLVLGEPAGDLIALLDAAASTAPVPGPPR